MNRYIILLAAVTIAATSCRTHKQNATDNPTVTTTHTLNQQQLDQRLTALAGSQGAWTSMQASGTVKLGGGKSLSSAMQMRMVRDKFIYISLRPMLGIEVGKIVIMNDSVLVVDKYHKRYIAEPISLITNDIPVTVGIMQDILLGRAFVLGQGSVNSQNKALVQLTLGDKCYALTPIQQPEAFSYSFAYDDKNHILSLIVTPKQGEQTPYAATYDNVQTTLAGNIAHHTQVSATVGGKGFTLSLDLKNVEWNKQVNVDDSRPTNYKRMNGQDIVSILDSK